MGNDLTAVAIVAWECDPTTYSDGCAGVLVNTVCVITFDIHCD